VVVGDDHCVRLPADVPFTPKTDGYWLSDEMFIRLLQRLNELQAKPDLPAQTGRRDRRRADEQYAASRWCGETVYN